MKELRNRARDVLLTQAIASEEKIEGAEPADDLLQVDGMDRELALQLASRGIVTREDLADQAIDDLLEIDGGRRRPRWRPDHGGAQALV